MGCVFGWKDVGWVRGCWVGWWDVGWDEGMLDGLGGC